MVSLFTSCYATPLIIPITFWYPSYCFILEAFSDVPFYPLLGQTSKGGKLGICKFFIPENWRDNQICVWAQRYVCDHWNGKHFFIDTSYWLLDVTHLNLTVNIIGLCYSRATSHGPSQQSWSRCYRKNFFYFASPHRRWRHEKAYWTLFFQITDGMMVSSCDLGQMPSPRVVCLCLTASCDLQRKWNCGVRNLELHIKIVCPSMLWRQATNIWIVLGVK